ncbi:MAG: NADP-dependent malic enzyme [Fimbriimonadaceae bacterium]|jgi:malate dehydrogenase (oxaloacetate-decarboxylating)|nr:NADP-dependent malic enzyme [Fimbriimonadaceae bacterium]
MSDFGKRSLELHAKTRGKFAIVSKVPLKTKDDLSLAYSPGVADVSLAVRDNRSAALQMTMKGNSVAIVSDGSAVLGLGNIGSAGALPVMEGKAILFKEFAGIDGVPIVLSTQDPSEIIRVVRAIAPTFGGINLEDIAAPQCFRIEEELQDLGIPVFHDDQHGTAIVLLAALLNACKVSGKKPEELNVVINGAGAAGTAIAKLLRCVGHDPSVCVPVKDVLACDSRGIVSRKRYDELNEEKRRLLAYTNRSDRSGTLRDALEGADVFIGVSVGGLLNQELVRLMAKGPIIFAMANPVPEIWPDEAYRAGASVVGTGRSDLPNQVNNVLAFPGIFRGALDSGATQITETMKIAAAHALADCVPEPNRDFVVPDPLDRNVVARVAEAVRRVAVADQEKD